MSFGSVSVVSGSGSGSGSGSVGVEGRLQEEIICINTIAYLEPYKLHVMMSTFV